MARGSDPTEARGPDASGAMPPERLGAGPKPTGPQKAGAFAPGCSKGKPQGTPKELFKKVVLNWGGGGWV